MSIPKHPEYKFTDSNLVAEVPKDWQLLPLRRLLPVIESGTSVNALDNQPEEGKPSVLKTSCVYTSRFRREECKEIVEEELGRATCPVKKDSLIVSRMNTPDLVGAAGLTDSDIEHLYLPDRLWQVRIGGLVPAFAYYWTQSNLYRDQVKAACSGTSSSMQNLSQEAFVSFFLCRPESEEQNQIASFLDRETAKIDALIAEQQRLIELLQEKRQAVISHAVTKGLNPDVPMKDSGVEWLGEVPEHWEVAQLKHFSRSLPGFAFSSDGFVDDGDKWKLLRGVNVGVSCIRWDDTVYWEREPGDGLDRYELSPGDLVVGLDRPLIKDGLRVARIKPEDCPCMLLQRVAAVKGVQALSTDYLYYLLSSPFFVAHFEPETTGVSVPHISTGQIDSFVVPIPPPGEQAEIVRFLSDEVAEIQRLVKESTRSSEILQERRAALISAAVTGQIDVRGLVQEVEEQ